MLKSLATPITWLFQAHPSVQLEDERRQVELFLVADAIILFLALIGAANAYLSGRSSGNLTGTIIMTSVVVLLTAAFMLARGPQYMRGIILTTALLCLTPYIEIISKAAALTPGGSGQITFLGSLAWLGPVLIFASILLPLRLLHAVIASHIFAVSLITLWFSGGAWLRAIAPMGLVTAVGGLVLLARLHSQRVERIHLSEIETARDELEQRVMERTAHLARVNSELQVARQAAEEAFRNRSSYLAEVSHDLRTPLTIILGFSEMLNYQAQAAGEEENSRYLGYIEASARYLVDLSKNLIDLARLERGDTLLEYSTVLLPDLLEEVLLLAGPLVAKKNNHLSGDLTADLGEIDTDPTCLRQILINLLSNAGKFTEDGEITLHAHRCREQHGQEWVVFDVTDTGIGMTPAQVQALFQPYPPSYRTTRDHYSGTGLGLAIAHLLCTKMGGAITVESKVNRGSKFTVRLPAHPDGALKPGA